jgi:hypothetical protein
MTRLIAVIAVLLCAQFALGAELLPNAGQSAGWRGYNNATTNYVWFDSWGSEVDSWGSTSMSDAGIGAWDRAAIQTAITAAGGAGNYNAYFHIYVSNNAGNVAAMAQPTFAPVVGIFDLGNGDNGNPMWGPTNINGHNGNGYLWYVGTASGYTFESAVRATAVQTTPATTGKSQWSNAYPYTVTLDAVKNMYDIKVNIGAALVDAYLNSNADGFFASNETDSMNGDFRLDGIGPQNPDKFITLEITQVPEPATMGLLLVGAAGMLIRRKR